jgi:hypothetical protein
VGLCLIGVVIGCATFALSASRIDSIKYSFDGSEYRSSLDRSRDDQAVLATHGGKVQGLNLQSYLSSARPTGSISTSRRCSRATRSAAISCSTSSWSPV